MEREDSLNSREILIGFSEQVAVCSACGNKASGILMSYKPWGRPTRVCLSCVIGQFIGLDVVAGSCPCVFCREKTDRRISLSRRGINAAVCTACHSRLAGISRLVAVDHEERVFDCDLVRRHHGSGTNTQRYYSAAHRRSSPSGSLHQLHP